MFLKSLTIQNNTAIIREILFHKGVNLIVDETGTKESGNNVGKTTVIRLIDFCLGGDGKNIYKDTEFESKSNTKVENFLKEKNIIVTLILKRDLGDQASEEIVIQRNFLNRQQKILTINKEPISGQDFHKELKQKIFHKKESKPTFRQIIAKNIRDEKNRLTNTLKVLHATSRQDEYEALYLFWLGFSSNTAGEKSNLLSEKQATEALKESIAKNGNLSQITQSLTVVEKSIVDLEKKQKSFEVDANYDKDIKKLNIVKSEINKLSLENIRLTTRRGLILESKDDLEKDISVINVRQIKALYEKAKSLVPSLHKTFEETIEFHNQMIKNKVKYITKELPELEKKLKRIQREIDPLLKSESSLSKKLQKNKVIESLNEITSKLTKESEQKGVLLERKEQWESAEKKLKEVNDRLEEINQEINARDGTIQKRITRFNRYFSDISNKLYGEKFILSSDKNNNGYKLNISTISGNLGTGKKKGQIAAFDLAYIQFADASNIKCLHFILHDQIEVVHGNQILTLLTDIVSGVNCQYIAPILKDKLPTKFDIKNYKILSLSQNDKLFRISD